jgi:hypothetical protein
LCPGGIRRAAEDESDPAVRQAEGSHENAGLSECRQVVGNALRLKIYFPARRRATGTKQGIGNPGHGQSALPSQRDHPQYVHQLADTDVVGRDEGAPDYGRAAHKPRRTFSREERREPLRHFRRYPGTRPLERFYHALARAHRLNGLIQGAAFHCRLVGDLAEFLLPPPGGAFFGNLITHAGAQFFPKALKQGGV